VPVSVEAITGFLELAKKEDPRGERSTDSVLQLAKDIHPLVLGEAFRARGQIRMLARKLLSRQLQDEQKIEKVLSFLCSESGSHDYTINRREARSELGLSVEKPDDHLYKVLKALYDDIASELELTNPYDPNVFIGSDATIEYRFRRALIESVGGGSHVFHSEGKLVRQIVQIRPNVTQEAISDSRQFEGWRLEK
jgi:hypothetical protein